MQRIRSTWFSFHLMRLAALSVTAIGLAVGSAPAAADEGNSLRWSWGSSNRVVGSGKAQREMRSVAGFQGIAALASMKLVLRQGSREGIELSADDNVLPLIETRVVDRSGVATLEVGFKDGTGISTRTPVVATIDLITLRSLSLAGSGDVVSEAFKSPALDVKISGSGHLAFKQLAVDDFNAKVSGSGDLELAGRATRVHVSISGSGDVRAGSLEADDVTIRVAGSGDVAVIARKTLDVSISGVGNVAYGGDPVVKSRISGIGKVVRQ